MSFWSGWAQAQGKKNNPLPVVGGGGSESEILYEITHLKTTLSGLDVVAKASGEMVIGKISGETVQVASGAYLASGIYVQTLQGGQVSGAVQVSGEVIAKVSGEIVQAQIYGNWPVKVSGEMVGAVQQGAWGTQVSGGVIISGDIRSVLSGLISIASGAYLASGLYVQTLQGGQVSGAVIISGDIRSVLSGLFDLVDRAARILGGVQVSGAVIISGDIRSVLSGIVDISDRVGRELGISKISGEIVSLPSTQPVKISGEIVQAQQYGAWPVKVSGETIKGEMRAYDLSALVYRDLVTLTSGSQVLRAGALADDLIARVSGQYVSLPSTQAVKISGEMVGAVQQGAWGVQVSGAVQVSGQVSLPSTQVVQISGQVVTLSGLDYATMSGQQVITTVNISGTIVRTEQYGAWGVNVSGDIRSVLSGVFDLVDRVGRQLGGAQVSGGVIISGDIRSVLSGLVSVASGAYLASGLYVRTLDSIVSGGVIISGDIRSVLSGQVRALISGDTIIGKVSGEIMDILVPTAIKTGLLRPITASSGGEVLHSGAVKSVIVKAIGSFYFGGEAPNRPYSGFGFYMVSGEAVEPDVDNFSRIYLVSLTSGEKVTFMGVA